MRQSAKDNMALMQDLLEEHPTAGGGGGSGGSGARRGPTLQRRTGASTMQNFPKQQRHFTARIVVLGDDRAVGRLAKAYYFFR